MPARTEGIKGFALIKKDGRLAFSDRKLSAELYFTGTLFRNPMNELVPGFIEPFNDL